ncbi:MAG: hypothetical protein Q9170_002164 [Blastenia crenularia]
MVFVSICTALYNYVPQGANELELHEGDLVYILEKSTEDDWWKAKKRARADEDEEPSGLIPNNYVEEARPSHHARALYDYDRQTDEELSFNEDSILSVYDTSDEDWTLVGLNGEFGFAPANYIELTGAAGEKSPDAVPSPVVARNVKPQSPPSLNEPASPQAPAAAIANIMSSRSAVPQPIEPSTTSTIQSHLPPRPQYTPDDSDEEAPPPSLPRRPPSQQLSPPPTQYASPRSPDSDGGVAPSPPYNRAIAQDHSEDRGHPSPGGFHLYSINEMVSAIGKKKKLPTTLGLNIATGMIMIAPEKSRDGPQQEWSAEKLTHYSIEGKHVFMELVRPSKSVDFHAGAKDTAQEIVAGLGEIAGAARAEGLREVLEIGAGGGPQKKGTILYDFMAQGDDEVTVAIGDDVIVLDDTKSEEWWMVRRLKNGKEGVVPSSYVERTGSTAPTTTTGINAGRSMVGQNRLEEERLSKEALKGSKRKEENEAKGLEVGPGVKPPERGSSLASSNGDRMSSQKSKRSSKDGKSSSNAKSKPDAGKIRTWTDRSGSFKVEAQFIGLKDGKIHLHKLNGVKIAVPVSKMAIQDLEYVERVTGVSLDDEKPLSDIKRRSTQPSKGGDRRKQQSQPAPKTGATLEPQKRHVEPKGSDYDWFDFFLKTGVNPYQCERYAFNFNKDSMDKSVLPDITSAVLRNLGLKEGDILRVMKFLDNKYGRTGGSSKSRNVGSGDAEEGEGDREGATSPTSGGGLFSGPGGALRNNTRKGRPAPAVQSNDVVDAGALRQGVTQEGRPKERSSSISTPLATVKAPPPPRKDTQGFDDDAIWDVKPSKQEPSAPQQPSRSVSTPASAAPTQPALTGSMVELSLLSQPLQPTPAQNTGTQQTQSLGVQPQQTQQPALQQQSTGANPALFSQIGQQPASIAGQQTVPQAPPLSTYGAQQNLQPQQLSQLSIPRQRPQAPPIQQGSNMLPPPPRPLSAPQTQQNNNFPLPPLQPQLTGFQPSSQQASIAPPGQSLDDLNRLRLQQLQQQQLNQQQLYSQPTGFGLPNQNINQFSNGINPQQTGYGQQPQFQPLQPQQTSFHGFQNPQPFINGQQTGSPFADPRPQGGFQTLQPQQTGYQGQFPNNFSAQRTASVNSYLQPALQPQNTGINGFQTQFAQAAPPLPPIPQQHQAPAPLQPQKTGPAPPVSFGAPAANKLMPQPTGKRANLSQASFPPDNIKCQELYSPYHEAICRSGDRNNFDCSTCHGSTSNTSSPRTPNKCGPLVQNANDPPGFCGAQPAISKAIVAAAAEKYHHWLGASVNLRVNPANQLGQWPVPGVSGTGKHSLFDRRLSKLRNRRRTATLNRRPRRLGTVAAAGPTKPCFEDDGTPCECGADGETCNRSGFPVSHGMKK